MGQLSFVQGLMSVRTNGDFKAASKIVLGIPGGPGIPGDYMDKMTSSLAKKIGAVPVIVDLPNHGSSKRLNPGITMTYPEARTLLLDLLGELSGFGSEIILFGHSLGAVIALDLLHSQEIPITKIILVGMPVEFERNPAFTKFLEDSGAPAFSDESSFEVWWRAVLPAYFYRQPTKADLDLLATGTSWFVNERFTVGLPAARATAAAINPELINKIIYAEGEKEIILPKDNFKRIAEAFPKIKMLRLEKSGHFPMLENPTESTDKIAHEI